MAEKVYKLFVAAFKDAWFEVSDEERQEMQKKRRAAFEAAGGKRINMSKCYWSSGRWNFFGLEEFPSVEAERQYEDALLELDNPKYLDIQLYLGTEIPTRPAD